VHVKKKKFKSLKLTCGTSILLCATHHDRKEKQNEKDQQKD